MAGIGRALASIVWRPWYGWSGLNLLAEQYPAPGQPMGQCLEKQTVQVNSIRWRRTASLCLTDQGLYLQIATAPAAFVPWQAIIDQGSSDLFMLPAHTLDLGQPKLVALRIYDQVYQQMAPYLQQKSQNPTT